MHKVYEKVPIQQCWDETGKNPITVRWLDINKGDEDSPEYRSRLVAQEIKRDKREDLFAATPPLEAKKMLFSMAVTEGYGYLGEDKENGMRIDFVDVRRAYFHAPALRRVYVALPEEDSEEGMCGLLGKSLYGTRDAAQNWADAYMKFMTDIGFAKGQASACTFWHERKELRVVVHGDDFTVLGWKDSLDWFWKNIQERFDCKHRGRLGPGKEDAKEIRILNRIVSWTKEGIEYEGDQRHVEICLRQLGLEKDSRTLSTPCESKAEIEEENLDEKEHTKHRGLTARLNYLGQDRSDIQYAVK